MKKLNQIELNEVFEAFVLIKEMNVRTSKNGKKYQQFKVRDESMELPAFLWDMNDYTVANFTVGVVVKLIGKKELYQGIPQINQVRMTLPKDDEPKDAALFEKQPLMSAKEIEEEVNTYIFKIERANWARIVRRLLEKYHDEFYSYPAAKSHHHNFPTGLCYHTLSMLRLAKSISALYPSLNPSLLYAGVILHDLGKVIELSGTEKTEYTLAGNLLGHIVLIDEEIAKAALELRIDDTQEDMLVLRHMIVAHHGQQEFGSPIPPKIMEAEVLHQIDNMDAKLAMIEQALDQVAPGEQTPRIMGLDGRNFYKIKE